MNEFKIVKSIGKGAYSKVKQVIRHYEENGESFEAVYAMKVSSLKEFK